MFRCFSCKDPCLGGRSVAGNHSEVRPAPRGKRRRPAAELSDPRFERRLFGPRVPARSAWRSPRVITFHGRSSMGFFWRRVRGAIRKVKSCDYSVKHFEHVCARCSTSGNAFSHCFFSRRNRGAANCMVQLSSGCTIWKPIRPPASKT